MLLLLLVLAAPPVASPPGGPLPVAPPVSRPAAAPLVSRPAAPAGSTPAAAPAGGVAGTPAPPPPGQITERNGWRRLRATVKGSMVGALTSSVPEDGSVVAAHFARIFMWDLDVRRDVDPGDELVVLWRRTPQGEIEVGAAAYTSGRLRRTLRAYRFTAPGDTWPSYWDETGQEVPRTLKASPLRSYEQITALLKDRPTHQGMDFKTPVGTPIHAPRAATVGRVDWKLRGNGHCLELRYDDGVVAKFLHLSATKVRPGARVAAGQVVALTGNTGRSTAPHLHYQLDRGGKTLDPIDYHGTTRRRLDARAAKAFAETRAALDALLR
jgi:hypothetical protein